MKEMSKATIAPFQQPIGDAPNLRSFRTPAYLVGGALLLAGVLLFRSTKRGKRRRK